MVTDKADGACQLHDVRFYNLLPRAIVCSSFGQSSRKLALARDDGTIEVWNMAYAPFLEKTIPGGEGVSIEGLAWAGQRLFSVSLAGTLIEWDLSKIPCVKQSILVTGNAAWCVDVSKDERLLAVGTEGGYINVYRLDNEELAYERILDKQEGRIVCCNFDWTGNFLVTGSTDAVRVWDVRNGHAVHKMTTGRANNKQETTVWAVLVLKDFTILSADSRGKLVVYDGQMGTVLEQHLVSTADLLCLALNEEKNIVFVGGVEPIIRVFDRADSGGSVRTDKLFVRSHNRRGHTHDIKTLATYGRYLFSGGIDGSLLVTSSPPFTLDTHFPLLPGPASMVAADSRLVLLKYVNYLEVWTLGPANAPAPALGGNKVLQIRSKNDGQILAAAIAPNGRWIVYSTEHIVRLLRYDYNRNEPVNSRLVRVRNTPEHFAVCYRAQFTADSKGLFLYDRTGGGTINFFSCAATDDSEEWDHKQSIDAGRWLSEMVTLSAVSQCSRYLVCADLASSIVVFERTAAKWKRSISLPRYKLPPTALALQPGRTRVAVAFSDHKLFVYDFDQFAFVFSTYLRLPAGTDPNHPISGIAFDPRHESAMVLQNGSKIVTLRFGPDIEEEVLQQEETSRAKKWRPVANGGEQQDGEGSLTKCKLRMVRDAPRLVSIEWLGESELVAIQANALSMVEHLPAAFRIKRYGKT
ncbi:AGAP006092-PA [Anopheles gambiae str. PEST]|uniref:AGAP006092-PA n=1 Tax=Anopheles gambiae TaxID=7165 RepID=Q7Q612_ANOGA|nr:AGAP006092-PA [Anopheles gambiae str. PEST]